ncbi:MAG TPA: amidohydrolase [Bryobacteraceae bacterium]|nr:amidohydrolase [Bryobacteraceae bacterium]
MRLVLLVLAAGLAFTQTQPATVYHNGKVITLSGKRPVAEAFAVRDNRFIAVGSNAEVLKAAGRDSRKVDLRGRTVVPGLIESHTHPIMAALSEIDGPVPVMHSIADIQAYIRQTTARLPQDRIVFVPKVYPSRLKERRYPNRYEIDEASAGRPAMCDNGYASVLNSVLLERAGITRDTPQPDNGKIVKDERGEPTGLVLGAPQLLSRFRQNRPRTHADMVWAIREMQKAYNRAGITSTADRSQGPDGFRAYQEVRRRGEMTVRTSVTFYIAAKGTPKDVAEEIRRIPFVTGWGDDWLRVGPLKTTVDGGILIGTAYLREPWGMNTQVYGYTDPDYRGVLSVTKENLFEMVRVGHELGWQLTAHTTGGGAVDLLLDAYEAADGVSPVQGRRHNVMHGNFVNARAIERAKKLGVIFDSQIAWLHCDGDSLKHVFGPERIKEFLPLRSLIDAGIVVAGGSDHMIKFDSRDAINPYHPFYGMWMSITRKTVDGAVLGPEQRVTRDEALRMWTLNGAFDSFDEKIKGSIEAGKLADFVIISKNYLTCPEDEIKDIEALMTVVDGKVVYERK